MAISVNYATPVFVNGYSCKNCTEVDEAKKHIDPARPNDGPFGINAKDGPKTPLQQLAAVNAPTASGVGSKINLVV